jgi:hypothetical protein
MRAFYVTQRELCKLWKNQTLVAHTCNPSYTREAGIRRIEVRSQMGK